LLAVTAHVVPPIAIIEGFEWKRQAAKAIMLTGSKQVPFPDCPVPAYITAFRRIKIE
jgi:hypothetical protein